MPERLSEMAEQADPRKIAVAVARVAWLFALLYLFLVAVELFGGSFKALGKDAAASLGDAVDNPLTGLFVGMLATVMVQSSSVTTAAIVGLVGTNAIALPWAIPMVMGANIGTTVTNTLVSLAYVNRRDEFRRAFAGATVHDFFNLLTVAIMFPLEVATGLLEKSATFIVAHMPAMGEGATFKSPVKTAVKWLAKLIEGGWEYVGASGGWLAAAMLLTALVIIMLSLRSITINMKLLMARRIEVMLNRVLRRSGLLGIVIGALITISVQSSSITTSLLVPMFGAGVLTVEAGFPIMVGANIGTTVTALLAATVTGPLGLTIAIVHLLFNVCGTLLFFPFKVMRRIPVRLAEWLADLAIVNRGWVIAYVLVIFIMLPAVGVFYPVIVAYLGGAGAEP